MKIQTRPHTSITVALVFALATFVFPILARAQVVSQTAKAGVYSVTLKVLPAESFRGPKAEMVRESGADPVFLDSPSHPNHHMVVFLEKDGKPVENAKVQISYHAESTQAASAWMNLPVVRMRVAGKSAATTHFGNNLKLAPGGYAVRVWVDGQGPATFHFRLHS